MLKRPSIAGLIEYKGRDVETGEQVHEIREPAHRGIEPVLDRETWQALLALFASRRRGRPVSATYLLSGVIRCGLCGIRLSGRPRYGSPYRDGEVRREYWCQPRADGKGCGGLSIDQRYADSIVEEAVKARLGDPRHAERLAKQAEHARAERETIRAAIRRAEETGTKLADRLGRGEVSDDQFDTANDALRARLARLHEQLAELDAPETAAVAVRDIQHEWDDGSVQDRRTLVRRAFPRLTIRPATGRGRAAISPDRFVWDPVAG